MTKDVDARKNAAKNIEEASGFIIATKDENNKWAFSTHCDTMEQQIMGMMLLADTVVSDDAQLVPLLLTIHKTLPKMVEDMIQHDAQENSG